MDPVAIAFYAIVCATLGVLAPRLTSSKVRMIVGAVTGILAAILLPIVRSAIGI